MVLVNALTDLSTGLPPTGGVSELNLDLLLGIIYAGYFFERPASERAHRGAEASALAVPTLVATVGSLPSARPGQ